MNQRDHILAMLERGPTCGTVFAKAFIPRYSAVLGRMKHKEGLPIDKRHCRQHSHDSVQWEWFLIPEPTQQELFW